MFKFDRLRPFLVIHRVFCHFFVAPEFDRVCHSLSQFDQVQTSPSLPTTLRILKYQTTNPPRLARRLKPDDGVSRMKFIPRCQRSKSLWYITKWMLRRYAGSRPDQEIDSSIFLPLRNLRLNVCLKVLSFMEHKFVANPLRRLITFSHRFARRDNRPAAPFRHLIRAKQHNHNNITTPFVGSQ